MARVIEVRRSKLEDTQIVVAPTADLAEGQVRLKIAAFGLTANNITYAVFGEAMQYWNFFPAPSGSAWGVVPMWGFADVVESSVEGLAVGERFYGYLPMAEELIATPTRVGARGFVDSSPHRADLPSAYNFYVRCSSDSNYSVEGEDVQMLLQPLFTTSFLIDDFLQDNEFFGATRVIATSASSKTAFGTAHLLHRRGSVKVTGLTSPANTEFTESLGCYDQVLTYDAVPRMAQEPSVLLDFAGNANVVRAVHEHSRRFADAFRGDRRHPLGCRPARRSSPRAPPGVLLRPYPSREDEPPSGAAPNCSSESTIGGPSSCPWQQLRWTYGTTTASRRPKSSTRACLPARRRPLSPM